MNDVRPLTEHGGRVAFDWAAAYPSRRSPVFARNIVSTSQPLATQAGIAALRAGGNALDAALATAITLTVVEPCSNGLGSDLFAIVWDGRELVGLNASGRAPAAWTPQRFKELATLRLLGCQRARGKVRRLVRLQRGVLRPPICNVIYACSLLRGRSDHKAQRGFRQGRKGSSTDPLQVCVARRPTVDGRDWRATSPESQ